MLVSYRKKFVFIKTAKTAGTSVEVFFEKYCFPAGEWTFSHGREEYQNKVTGLVGLRGTRTGKEILYNHMPAKEVKAYIGAEKWQQYFKFTVVRNPFDKMVSAYFHLHFIKSKHNKELNITESKNHIHGFRNWVKKGGQQIDKQLYLINGEIAVDSFIRYENLNHGIEEVCKKLNLDYDLNDLQQLKSGRRDSSISLTEFYDAETEQLVRDLYGFEIENFNYQLE